MSDLDALARTPLYALHQELGARLVPFAGYAMPVQYPAGLIAEHRHTRTAAGLFDVSHMGQVRISAPNLADAARALESLMPVDVLGLAPHRQRYGLLLNDAGGILDDLMMVNRGGHPSAAGPPQGASAPLGGSDPSAAEERGGSHFFLIVNGACKAADLAHIQARIGARCTVTPLPDQALLALQGPHAVTALARLVPGVARLVFMTGGDFAWKDAPLYITRSGYTGEDGFEISLPASHAEAFARALLAQPEVRPIGLGARNSLRLEAGLCLYGNDIDATTTPVEAGLTWAIPKVRRRGGERAGGFSGADKVLAQLAGDEKPVRLRVGLMAQDKTPVREPAPLTDAAGNPIGHVTSGLPSPTLGQPIAMGYVAAAHAAVGTEVFASVRGRAVPLRVAATPFVPARYYRG